MKEIIKDYKTNSISLEEFPNGLLDTFKDNVHNFSLEHIEITLHEDFRDINVAVYIATIDINNKPVKHIYIRDNLVNNKTHINLRYFRDVIKIHNTKVSIKELLQIVSSRLQSSYIKYATRVA